MTQSVARIAGVISDTHGLLRPEALRALAGVDHILHAGDIGNPAVLESLRAIAPVTAIRGNNDENAEWARELPDRIDVTLGGRRFHMLHDLKQLDVDPAMAGHDVVVAGHSHKPRIEERDGVLYVNPGSAGPRRFSLPVSVARIDIGAHGVEARIIELDVPPPARKGRK